MDKQDMDLKEHMDPKEDIVLKQDIQPAGAHLAGFLDGTRAAEKACRPDGGRA